jgi:hypothetical protein
VVWVRYPQTAQSLAQTDIIVHDERLMIARKPGSGDETFGLGSRRIVFV